ncbi:phosphoenolpyruvate--protein phosphotransferase [Natronorubrum texcoconense]|uniref:Phosphoenolpyruvate-protein phosphotransferase n=1 Tax=Natronorubrum texcoconense TaxID=1095776 RepID=A0A1G8XAT8_9EURY|nr:phosphoenolpyruvate--protein phosphotransferase [Natronorubrum texcoconense]SDJ87534.1 phosphotransferase system, enzyme I, PtsI [Natronorubrum texcoconense]
MTEPNGERRLEGTGVTPAVGVGPVHWLATDLELPEPPDADAVDRSSERERIVAARERALETLERERAAAVERVGESEAEIFDAHAAFLTDPQLEDGIDEAVDDDLPAEHAVQAAFEGPIAQFEAMEGPMAERADDLRDVRDRLVRELLGRETAAIPSGSVLLADRLTPSDTAGLDPDSVAGVATVTGGRTAHAAIIARALGLPAVVGVGEELRALEAGTQVVVDGERGRVIADPDPETRNRAERDRRVEPIAEPVETADGRPIEVAANVGGDDFAAAATQGADGIGLFRTEFLFLDREEPPTEDEQCEAYADALETFPDGRVIVRTIDVGGDKPLPYREGASERNPFLGARGIRVALEELSDLFETQLRAICRAAATEGGGELAVMFPMIATVEELEEAQARLEAAASALAEEGIEYERPTIGVMIETPSAAFIADELAARVDFLSIGTNDLTQYVMAADRENERVADLQDPLHPAVLRAIDRTTSHGSDAWVGVCGELAGDPAVTELLMGLGVDELSTSPIAIPAVKRRVREVEASAARALADRALEAGTRDAVARLLDGE